MFFFLWFFGMFCLWERQVVAVTEPGGKEKRVADLSNMRRLHIDYHQQKLHTQPPPPPSRYAESWSVLPSTEREIYSSTQLPESQNFLGCWPIWNHADCCPPDRARLYVVKEMWRRRRQYFQGCRDNHEVLCGKAYEAWEDVLQYRHLTIRKHCCSSSFRNKSHFQAV